MPMDTTSLPELGFYALAGGATDPTVLRSELADGERIGLGSACISERFNVKEAASLCGAAVGMSERLGVWTGATNHSTRHPIVTASMATTLHKLSGGRFCLGLGRGIDPMMDALGVPRTTTAQLEDVAGLYRRLWHGETVLGHSGAAGSWPFLRLDPSFDENIPLALTAFGPKTLELAGRSFDAVILHTFFTDETLVRCVRTVKDAAEKAGRDPASVRVWSVFATIGDHLPEAVRLKKTVGRLATYLQAYGDLMVRTNGWDPKVLARFRADPAVTSIPGAIDQIATTEQLERIAPLLPAEWLAPAAIGSPERCATAVLGQLDLGADSVILHGAAPAELEPIVGAYREIRPAGRFEALPRNPGLS
jgi:5,10-methylenetetrahydromethanopterin reductase